MMDQSPASLSHNPWLHILLPTAISLVVVSLVAVVRWLMSRDAWKYHPKGGGGFLADEFARYAFIFLPFLLIAIGIRYYFYVLHPEQQNSPQMYASFMLMLVARIVIRRTPIAKSVARHIDAARARAKADKTGASV